MYKDMEYTNKSFDNIVRTENKEKSSATFEEALKLAGVGRYNVAIFLISIFSLIAAAAEIFSVSLLLSASQCDLELDVYKKGLIGSVPMLGVIASAHLWGYVADTRGRKFALTLTTTGTFVGAVIGSFSGHWIFMAVSKFFSAACASGTNAVIYALLGETTPETHRPKYLMLTATGVHFSMAFNAILAFPILQFSFSIPIPYLGFNYRPWRLLGQTFGFLSAINLILLLTFVFESAKYHFAKGNHDKGLDILRKIYAINTGKSRDDYQVKHVDLGEEENNMKNKNIFASIWNQTAPLFHKQQVKQTLLVCYLCIMVFSVGSPISIWLPVVFEAYSLDLNTDKSFCQLIEKHPVAASNTSVTVDTVCNDNISNFTLSAMVVVSCYLVVVTAITVVLIKLTGKKWMFIGLHFISGCCGLIVNHIFSVWGVTVFIGVMSCVMSMGIAFTYAVEMFPTYLRAMGVCLSMMVGRAFSFFVINMMGAQLETNCDNFLYIYSAFIFSGSLVGLLLPSDAKKAN